MIAPAALSAIDGWLGELSALKNASANTLLAYRTDVLGFVAFQQTHQGGPMGTWPADAGAAFGHARLDGVGTRTRGLGPVAGAVAFGGEGVHRLAGRA